MEFEEWWAQPQFSTMYGGTKSMCRYVWEAAVAEEREACANVCDAVAKDFMHFDDVTAAEVKARIMKRSNKISTT